MERDGLAGDRYEALDGRPKIIDIYGVGNSREIADRLVQELRHKEYDDAGKEKADSDIHGDDSNDAVYPVAYAPLCSWLESRSDDDGGQDDKDDVAQVPEHVDEDEYEDALEYRACGDGDSSVVHGVMIAQESIKSKTCKT